MYLDGELYGTMIMMTSSFDGPSTISAGLRCRCPRCGEGALFSGFLTVAKSCDRCGLDYGFADQRAVVSVAGPEPGSAFAPAGVWYTAGSNACVYSNPPGELDPSEPLVQTSNRRFREDEFLVPPRLTRGRSSIRVRLEFAPRPQPLVPGGAAPAQAWSEYRYWAYTYVVPTDAP